MQTIEIVLALAGLVSSIIWILLRSNWATPAKILCAFFAGALGIAFVRMLHAGIVTKQDAVIVVLFGLGGLVVLATLATRRWPNGWPPWAIGVCSLVLAMFMVYETQVSRPGTVFPTIPVPVIPVASPEPVAPSVPPAPDPTPAPTPRASARPATPTRPAPVRPRTSSPIEMGGVDCDEIPYDYKAAAECPVP